MIWHYDRCVKFVAFAVIVRTVLEDGVSGLWSKDDSIGLAEGHE